MPLTPVVDLTRIIRSGERTPGLATSVRQARAIIDAGYRKRRTITRLDQVASLPDGSVVLDKHGDVSQKRGGMWCGYETAPLMSGKLTRIGAPLTVLYDPAEEN